jgi:hypothetical protein
MKPFYLLFVFAFASAISAQEAPAAAPAAKPELTKDQVIRHYKAKAKYDALVAKIQAEFLASKENQDFVAIENELSATCKGNLGLDKSGDPVCVEKQ